MVTPGPMTVRSERSGMGDGRADRGAEPMICVGLEGFRCAGFTEAIEVADTALLKPSSRPSRAAGMARIGGPLPPAAGSVPLGRR